MATSVAKLYYILLTLGIIQIILIIIMMYMINNYIRHILNIINCINICIIGLIINSIDKKYREQEQIQAQKDGEIETSPHV